jgi:hypothetical protein
METTAIYPNRIADKEKLERLIGLPEDGTGIRVRIITKTGYLVSVGYIRIVYGDHGPYIEMDRNTVYWKNFDCERKGIGYYDKWFSPDRVMLYDQLKTVSLLRNPPQDGKTGTARNNVEGGYADYRIGKIYVDPYQCKYKKEV